ncbi:MAG: diacylglycerol/lipid kinase family protein, partial [Gemmatimonadaceae bacterium]
PRSPSPVPLPMPSGPASHNSSKLKAFLNSECGNAEAAREALDKVGFDLSVVRGVDIESRLKQAIDSGATRILVAGGDGTIATAAALVAKTQTELAILPGGTLNHFAKDHRIPTDLGKAALIAGGEGIVQAADIGYVNDCVFLNTSSIGAYVTFVRDREHLEKRVGYGIATMAAFVKTLSHLRNFTVTLEVDGGKKTYRSSLVFIGVGERELKMPSLGSRVKDGRSGLHVMIVRGRARARLFAIALAAIAKGTKEAGRLPEFDNFIVDRCRIDLNRASATVGLDGELKQVTTPLNYRIEHDALRLVTAAPEQDE